MAADLWIYHEKQDAALCGQHCLNNLVQDRRFTAPDLAELAHQLDAREREVMLQEGADTPDALKFLAEESGNIDNAGNFSVQVLSEALERGYGLRLVSAGSSEVSERLRTTGYDREEGFVCNRHDHWLAIRCVGGMYWNLNSTLDYPEHITTFALEATLAQIRADGYSVFVVRGGQLPEPHRTPGDGEHSSWYRVSELLAFSKQNSARNRENRAFASAGGGGASKKPPSAAEDVWMTPGRRLDGREAGQGHEKRGRVDGGGGASSNGLGNLDVGADEDADIAAAIALSLSEAGGGAAAMAAPAAVVPEEPPANAPGAVRVQFRLPAERIVRRFLSSDPASTLANFVEGELKAKGSPNFELLGPQGKPLVRDALAQVTIGQAGLGGASIMVRLLC